MQVDYVKTFTQSPIDNDLYLKVPAGFQVYDEYKYYYSLKIHIKIYDQKQAGRAWYNYLN